MFRIVAYIDVFYCRGKGEPHATYYKNKFSFELTNESKAFFLNL